MEFLSFITFIFSHWLRTISFFFVALRFLVYLKIKFSGLFSHPAFTFLLTSVFYYLVFILLFFIFVLFFQIGYELSRFSSLPYMFLFIWKLKYPAYSFIPLSLFFLTSAFYYLVFIFNVALSNTLTSIQKLHMIILLTQFSKA